MKASNCYTNLMFDDCFTVFVCELVVVCMRERVCAIVLPSESNREREREAIRTSDRQALESAERERDKERE